MQEQILKTERLTIWPVADRDLEEVHQLQSLPEITRFHTADIPANIRETEALLSSWISNPKNGVFAMTINDPHQFIGLIVLNPGKEK